MVTQEDLDWVISVDDHVIEPPHVWERWLPQKFKALAPRVLREDFGDIWMYEDKPHPVSALTGAATEERKNWRPTTLCYDEANPACYDPKARLKTMDEDHNLAAIVFPQFAGHCGETFLAGKDKDLALACIQAYNDWQIDEWCATDPNRFFPLALIPLWDPKAAAKEIERTAKKGARAVSFSELPYRLGLPSIHKLEYWDPVFGACNEANLPLCTHTATCGSLQLTSPDAPLLVANALKEVNMILCMEDWLFSANFNKYPNLKLCLSEGNIGWIPYFLEKSVDAADRHWWAGQSDDEVGGQAITTEDKMTAIMLKGAPRRELRPLNLDPRKTFREHIFGCFIQDQHGCRSLDEIGIDNVMINTDFPHGDSSYPNTLEIARKALSHLSDEDVYKVIQGNARRVFNIDPVIPRQVRPATVAP